MHQGCKFAVHPYLPKTVHCYLPTTPSGWQTFSFVGDKWNNINKEERKLYLKNAYRVLLTRARQGMVIVVPEGDEEDVTRKLSFYDETFEYLEEIIKG